MQQTETIQQAKEIVDSLAGSPAELTRQLKRIGLRYCKTNKGFNTYYIIRGKGIDRIKIKL